jgi:hypothetical protein
MACQTGDRGEAARRLHSSRSVCQSARNQRRRRRGGGWCSGGTNLRGFDPVSAEPELERLHQRAEELGWERHHLPRRLSILNFES